MKKTLLATVLALLSAIAFAQEKKAIAVFPFEDMDNVFKGNESVFFYRRFSNEFSNKSKGKFTVVGEQDVQKLIDTEAGFQLSRFAKKEKTAEMNRVLGGAQILSGYVGKIGYKITISISLFTYPDLEQLPGGVDLDVNDVDQLFKKIPDLVDSMLKAILPPPPPPPLGNYTIYNSLTIFGYTYSKGLPLGFSLGYYGLYTSLGFVWPWDKIRYEIVDWILGYNITIIPGRLYLPLGIGIESVKELQLEERETNLLFEAGLLFRPSNDDVSPYIFGSYRYIMPDKQNFSIGVGISFEDK